MNENAVDPFRPDSLESWVINKCDGWRDHYTANYEATHEEYYRIWRGIWAAADKTRDSERSKLISPATQQAVESAVAEIEEATFGRGRWFDISDDDNQEIAKLRDDLYNDAKKNKIRKSVGECLLNAAVFGTGIAEVVLDEIRESVPATQDILGGDLKAVGVNIQDRTVCKLRPVMPKNFLIDPLATSVEEALGVAVDEFVSLHSVELLQTSGVYNDVMIGTSPSDSRIEPDNELSSVYDDDKVRLTKYFGLVPRYLLESLEVDEDEDIVELVDEDASEGASEYVEAIVVIANGTTVLKAEENPYMMQDRPVVAFQWDIVPGRFWGRGICEKAYNSQKALDAELRGRTDALALTIHPMLAMDASRLPRGTRPEVRPGKVLLTNGNPADIIQPFNFGNVSQITFAQAGALQQMVQMATGSVDSAGIAGNINGEATAAGISMSLGAIIKRQKRTLVNFQESFLIPAVTKIAHRYMQFEPELYPAQDYTFNASSSLGIMAREYEVTQLVQLLQTTDKDSVAYAGLVKSVIDNMNLSNREELMTLIDQAGEVSPEAQAAQAKQAEMQMAFLQSQTDALKAQAAESEARADKYRTEAAAIPVELKQDSIKIANDSIEQSSEAEFRRRSKIGELMLQERTVAKGELG